MIINHQQHNSALVYYFQKYFVDDLVATAPADKRVIYFTDESRGRYKNKKILNVCNLKQDFGLKGDWNYFASVQGKNTFDSIGVITKREVIGCQVVSGNFPLGANFCTMTTKNILPELYSIVRNNVGSFNLIH